MEEIDKIRCLIKHNLPTLAKEYNIKRIGVFGSYTRGDQRKGSDIDLLVEFTTVPTLLEFISLEHKLENVLGSKVDLVMKTALKPKIGKKIIEEVEYI